MSKKMKKKKRAPKKPYMKSGLRWEDPCDGYGPPKHRSQKKGARQEAKKRIKIATVAQ